MVGSIHEVPAHQHKEVPPHAPEMRPYHSHDNDDIESGVVAAEVAAHDRKVGIENPTATYKEGDGISDDSRVGSVRDDDPNHHVPVHTQWTWTPLYIHRRWPWILHICIWILFTA